MQCAFFKRWCWFFLIERHVLSTWSMAKSSIFLGLLHFYPPHIMCFAHCLLEFQNQAMYLLSFIIVCNVHFLGDNILFFIYIKRHVLFMWPRAKWSIYKNPNQFSLPFVLIILSIFSLSFLFPLWSVLDKHLAICFSPIKKYPPRKSFGFAKIFVKKNVELCDMGLLDF